jgi:hypothetical protein
MGVLSAFHNPLEVFSPASPPPITSQTRFMAINYSLRLLFPCPEIIVLIIALHLV